MFYRRQWLFLGLGALLVSATHAQVTMDGTLGPPGPLTGPDYAITPDLGQQLGGNLFYSFGQFSIYAGESATFSGPGSITNIIGRVTGGDVSFIDGAIRSTIPGANLYLLNPAGVLFGEYASLDVPGSVHISTADYLRLSDGGRFDARTPGESVLTVAPVEAFGFLSATPAPITVNGSFLQVPEGQTLSLIGGDITLTNATLYAPAGRINVAAVGSPGEVLPTDHDLVLQGFGALGALTISRDPDVERVNVDMGKPFGKVELGDLDASGAGGGAIFIRGGQWVSRGGWVRSTTYGARAGQDVDVAIADTLTLLNGGEISASTWDTGNAGAVTISARNLLVAGAAFIVSDTWGGWTIGGDAGDMNLTIADTIALLNGGLISSSTYSSGNAGAITISARNLLVDGQGADGFTSIQNLAMSEGAGGGNINLIIADTVTLLNGGKIFASAWGTAAAGSVTISARNLLVDAQGGYGGRTGIISDALGSGAGGKINLTIADTVILLNSSEISANTQDAGDAGSITISARNLLMDAQGSRFLTPTAGINTSALYGTGAGGDINLTVTDTLMLLNGAQISAATYGPGDAGSITISAGQAVTITGGIELDGQRYPSGLFVSSSSTGQAGDLTLTTPNLTITDGGGISARSLYTTGGNLFINADYLKLLNGSEISTSVFGNLYTQGGNITLNSINIVALNSSSVTAKAKRGKGGKILVNADVFLHDAARVDDVLNASSEVLGNDGTVQNNAPTTDISGSLVALDPAYLDAASQLSPRCGTGDPEARSRFVVQGRGNLPPDPGDVLTIQAGRCSAAPDASLRTVPPAPLQTAMTGFGDR